jgi:hypothetical protein
MDPTATPTTGPTEAPGGHDTDRPDERPGVPMEAERAPETGAHWAEPQRQTRGGEKHLHRAGLDDLTHVFGTAQPPRGVSGMLRKAAYRVPEHYGRHWMMLMAADRIDVLEGRLGETLADPMERIGFDAGAHYARTNPLAVVAGTVVGAWLARKVIF